jgi:hypothetical protein
MSFIYLILKGFEDSFTCGCDTTDSVRYHLRAKKIDLSLKVGLVSMPYGSAHITCVPLKEYAWQPDACPMHALYIRVDSEAHRGMCGYNCFGELNSLVEVNLGMTSEFYLHHRYNWHTYGGFVRLAQKACSQGECWLYEACALLTFLKNWRRRPLTWEKALNRF